MYKHTISLRFNNSLQNNEWLKKNQTKEKYWEVNVKEYKLSGHIENSPTGKFLTLQCTKKSEF